MSKDISPLGLAFGLLVISLPITTVLAWLGIWPYIPAAFLGSITLIYFWMKDDLPGVSLSDAIGFGAAALGCIALGAYMTSGIRDEPNRGAEIRKMTPAPTTVIPEPRQRLPVDTNVDEMLDIFAENQVAGMMKFGKGNIKISGKVVRVREALGTGIIVLQSPKSGRTIEIGFSDRGTPKLAPLRSGDAIIATCPTTFEAMGEVLVGGCSSVVVR